MKRTKFINLATMRKGGKFALLPLAAAVMSGCAEDEVVHADIYEIQKCAEENSVTIETCQVAYQYALDQARKENSGSGFDGSSIITGYMLANIVQSFGGSNGALDSAFRKDRNYSGGVVTMPDGKTVPLKKYKPVSGKSVYSAPTIKRSGFGSTASAKSSWGSSKSSGGWGG